jgi:aspartyl-tRNA(Asn)/glutamyl-tRNA(Gln) amidotransferase subunit B
LADILVLLERKKISSNSAKQLLAEVFANKSSSVLEIATSKGLLSSDLPDDEYRMIVRRIIQANPNLVEAIVKKGQKGKIMGLLGMVMREMSNKGKTGGARPDRVKHFIEDELNTYYFVS